MTRRWLLPSAALATVLAPGVHGQSETIQQEDKFRQLEELWPTPNDARAPSGAPGPGYWQQQVDYEIDVELDDEQRRIVGSERIRYHNRSPDTLHFLWVQLDANLFAPDSDAVLTQTTGDLDSLSFQQLANMLARTEFDGGVKIGAVEDEHGTPLHHVVNKTMMRVDLPAPLPPAGAFTFSIDWSYAINPSDSVRGRTGYEYFEEDDNCLYEIAQWFPRLAAYTDVNGWQHKQFLGRGEFTLEFGNYLVRITAPADHVVTATGELQNPEEVLSEVQRERLAEAHSSERPLFVITPEEAKANESSRSTDKKTWIFQADNVRDFAFASSRKFIWDAMGQPIGDRVVTAMSFYPNEGEPLWSRYSTHAVAHALEVFSRYTFDYPYPVAISVNGPVGGMEYPMICFNGPRPEKDGTYSERTKYGLIGVVIHEVGHNWFPMIVNSDERQWTWMDEGLTTFVQFLAQAEWEDEYPSRRGEPKDIVSYMSSPNQMPIMTNSESLLQFGSNAYAKPATALNVLRETVLGRELFDFAFQQYSRRWMFKRPQPSDLFRTLEDASAVDLDWFWRGWFYSTDHCDLAITDLTRFEVETGDPDHDKGLDRARREAEPESLIAQRNAELPKRTDRFPELLDFYNEFDELDVTDRERSRWQEEYAKLSEEDQALLALDRQFYVVDFANLGGLVMPILLRIVYADGSEEELRIPAEIWRRSPESVRKLLITEKAIAQLELDPHLETADVDRDNNHWPPREELSRFRLFQRGERSGDNPMRAAREANEGDEQAADGIGESEDAEVENKGTTGSATSSGDGGG